MPKTDSEFAHVVMSKRKLFVQIWVGDSKRSFPVNRTTFLAPRLLLAFISNEQNLEYILGYWSDHGMSFYLPLPTKEKILLSKIDNIRRVFVHLIDSVNLALIYSFEQIPHRPFICVLKIALEIAASIVLSPWRCLFESKSSSIKWFRFLDLIIRCPWTYSYTCPWSYLCQILSQHWKRIQTPWCVWSRFSRHIHRALKSM